MFRVDFFRELVEIIRNKDFKLTILTIKTAVVSLTRANNIARFINQQAVISEETICYSFWTDDAGISLALLKRKHPYLKCVSRAHGWDLYFTTNPIHYLPFRWLITSNLDRIVTDSIAGSKYILDKWTNASQTTITPSQMGVKMQDKLFGIPSTFVVISCANLVPVKRIHLLAEALLVLGQTTAVKWVHFGDGELMLGLRKMLNENKTPNLEVELKGHVLNDEVLNWYKTNKATVFVNVSASEGVPVSVMEAMSFGIPVIATDVGGNSEIVNSNNGRLLPADFELSELCEALMFFKQLAKSDYILFSNEAIETQRKQYQDEINYQYLVDQLKE
jgi:glycosyltransferase involved in cell wall biosynthesis